MSIICYDTLVTSRRSNYVEAARLVEADTHLVIDRSASKRLSWESQYTSHSSHYSSPSIPQPASMDRSEQTRYFIIACMAPIKYLGLTLDGRWPCASYFAQLRPWAAISEWRRAGFSTPSILCRRIQIHGSVWSIPSRIGRCRRYATSVTSPRIRCITL